MPTLSKQDFLGAWQIERHIYDQLSDRAGTLVGTARFVLAGGDVQYSETGTLRWGQGAPMQATRTYVWKFDDKDVAVQFENGAPFHDFRLDHSAPTAAHFCRPDHYEVAYDFATFPSWSATWRVKGPRKDYEMVTNFVRP